MFQTNRYLFINSILNVNQTIYGDTKKINISKFLLIVTLRCTRTRNGSISSGLIYWSNGPVSVKICVQNCILRKLKL